MSPTHKRNPFDLIDKASAMSRREMLTRGGGGVGALALSWMLGSAAGSLAAPIGNPMTPKLRSHFGRAKSVIFLFMEGGPSQIDLFDPKPLVNELAGQPMPKTFKRPVTAMGEQESPLLAS